MYINKGIRLIQQNNTLTTDGLNQIIGREINVLSDQGASHEYSRVLKYLIDYIVDYSPNISPRQTIAYHSWLLQLSAASDLLYELYEASLHGDGFVQGVDYSIKVLREQEEECQKRGITPLFPTFRQKVVISKGVYEGLEVNAVRYPSPEHMSGWWLTTGLYDNDIDSLESVHFFHLAFKRPEILRYLALPFGYRFSQNQQGDDIWFDESALE